MRAGLIPGLVIMSCRLGVIGAVLAVTMRDMRTTSTSSRPDRNIGFGEERDS